MLNARCSFSTNPNLGSGAERVQSELLCGQPGLLPVLIDIDFSASETAELRSTRYQGFVTLSPRLELRALSRLSPW